MKASKLKMAGWTFIIAVGVALAFSSGYYRKPILLVPVIAVALPYTIIFLFRITQAMRSIPEKTEEVLLASGAVLFLVMSIVFSLLCLLSIVFQVSAAENSTPPAPAENAITVKGYTSCPTEFDIADPGWALHRIDNPMLQKLGEDMAVLEHSTLFSYFPDPAQRAQAETNHWKNRDCVAQLFAYGNGIERQNVWAAIRASGKLTVFLATNNGWEKGGEDIPENLVTCNADGGCALVFILHKNGEFVAARVLPMEQLELQ